MTPRAAGGGGALRSAPERAVDDDVTAERCELKFVFPSGSVDALRDVLELNARRVQFGDTPVSRVHSIYFDDHRGSSCEESLAGVARRVKLRLRWYDAPFPATTAYFEVKRRLGQLTRKERTPIELPDRLDGIPYAELVPGLVEALDPEAAAMLAVRGLPTQLVAYRREHFRDPDSPIRVTLDHSIEGFPQLGLRAPARVDGIALERLAVIEVKVPPGGEAEVRRLLHPLAPRLSRCSKYVHCCLADGASAARRMHE